MAGIMLLIMLFGESVSPGSLTGLAFTDIGIFSIFSLLILEAFFSYGNHD